MNASPLFNVWEPVATTPTLLPDTLHLWRLEFSTTTIATTQDFLICSAAEQTHAATLKRTRQRFLYTRALRRRILGSYLGIAPELVQFGTGSYGKPYIVWPRPALQFNISHSGSLCLLAVYWGSELGVDVEQIRSRPGIVAIAQRMFAPKVSAKLVDLPESAQLRLFYYHWTRLEARIKIQGDGLFSSRQLKVTPRYLSFTPCTGFQGCIAAYSPLPPMSRWGLFTPAPGAFGYN